MRRTRRWLLRGLGVPYHIQDTFLDPRRWSVTISSHAISQAGERYRQGDPKIITLEVIDAYCHSRFGDRTPDKRHGAKKNSFLAWTADQHKVYVVKPRKRTLVVVTALPTAWADAEAEKREARSAARKEHKLTTKVARAFAAAGWEKS